MFGGKAEKSSSPTARRWSVERLRRAAYAQPRVLLTGMALTLLISTWWAIAQRPGPDTAGTTVGAEPAATATDSAGTWTQLPALMRAYGAKKAAQRRAQSQAATQAAASGATTSGATTKAGSVTPKAVIGAAPATPRLFALTEVDLTPGNKSDEREPTYRPDGEYIAFSSNGADLVNNDTNVAGADGRIDSLNAEKRYHIWIMKRDGSDQRRITGLGSTDLNRDQRDPSWSPNGNTILYSDGTSSATAQLFFATSLFAARPTIQQVTFFPTSAAGRILRAPAFSPSGTALAFVANFDPATGTSLIVPGKTKPQLDIFTIAPSGTISTLRRLTGDPTGVVDGIPTATDPQDLVGNTTDDDNPFYSLVSADVLFFSSNRQQTNPTTVTALVKGRRVWSMGAITGGNKRQITDPLQRPQGTVDDVDDRPSVSRQALAFGSEERMAFESNTLIDSTDIVRDLNIWSLPVDSPTLRPTPIPPAPALTVTSFTNGVVKDFRVDTGTQLRSFQKGQLTTADGLAYGNDVTGDGYPDLFISNSSNGNGTVDLYDGITARFLRTFAPAPFSFGTVSNPSGLTFGPDRTGDGEPELYVASGPDRAGPPAVPSTDDVRIFNGQTGNFVGTFVTTGAVGVITNGITGITFGNDINGDGVQDFYAAAIADNAVYAYNGQTGTFIRAFVPANRGGLFNPTGIAFGTDLNSDGRPELFVSSSSTNSIKVYNGVTGAFIRDFATGISQPYGLAFGTDGNGDGSLDLYVAEFQFGFGDSILRFDGKTGAALPAAGQFGSIFSTGFGLQGPRFIAFNPVASGAFVPGTATLTPVEAAANVAELETSTLSSPTGKTAAAFNGAQEDKSADREPSITTDSTFAADAPPQIAFASQRVNPARPGVTGTQNPGGGPQFISGTTPSGATHDIWVTTTTDVTPPVLVPITAGNQLFPFLAPGHQAPFFAPRAPQPEEGGLGPGETVKIGLVLDERESGLAAPVPTTTPGPTPVPAVQIIVKDADKPTFSRFVSNVNGSPTLVRAAEVDQEGQPEQVAGPWILKPYDDGPVTAGGHERQASAVRGDGIYYCEGQFPASDFGGTPLDGDFYMDLQVVDRAGNSFLYDNVYGFSTRAFNKRFHYMFVSDYTIGQEFAVLLSGFAPRSEIITQPCESYYLTNPGGTIATDGSSFTPGVPNAVPTTTPSPLFTTEHWLADEGQASAPSLPEPAAGTVSGIVDLSTPATDRRDVWRILSRGEVPQNVLDLYTPTAVNQLDPAILDTNGDGQPDAIPTKTPQPTKKATVSDSYVVWGSPYTGNVFAAPGTLYDAETQRRLTAYLDRGGRLFVTGQDIVYALSNAGTQTNDFLENELNARFQSEGGTVDVAGAEGPVISNRDPTFTTPPGPDPPNALHLGSVAGPPTYADCANNRDLPDVFSPAPASVDETITACYNYGGGRGGQRIEHRNRGDGFESRVVFFSFGFEDIHREYRIVTINNTPFYECRNFRSKIASNVENYFLTGGLSGKVINAATNLPIPNFYLIVTGPVNFLVRTDARGEYSLTGLPPGGYNIAPAETTDPATGIRRSLNGAYFPSATLGAFIANGSLDAGNNFRILPLPPGNITGLARNDNKTPGILGDDTEPAPNLPVLIRSVQTNLPPTDNFPGGGSYAAITITDAAGRFSFSNLPANVQYEIVFNPRPGLVSVGGDIPNGTGIVYPTTTIKPSTSFGRRVIPLDPTYGGTYTGPPIIPPVGNTLDLGLIPVPPGTGPGGGGGPTPTPAPTPIPGVIEFQIGITYLISLPYADFSATPTATTTAAGAFSVLPTASDGTVNFTLTRYNPKTLKYEKLGNNSVLRRGEGYFIKPVARTTHILQPSERARLVPTNVTEFPVVLHRSLSLAPTDPSNGFNLIGFPFNPKVYKSVDWLVSRVVTPDGHTYSTLTQAAAAGVLDGSLLTLEDAGVNYITTTKMVPFKGYYARTYIDGVTVYLKASTAAP